MGVLRYPATRPNAFGGIGRDKYASDGINSRIWLRFLNELVGVLENRAIEFSIPPGVLGKFGCRQFHFLLVFVKDVFEIFYVFRLRQVETKPESNHAGDNGKRLRGSPSIFSRLAPLFLELPLADSREVQSLFGRVFPEVDASPQPVVVALAATECLQTSDDPQGSRQAGAVVADDSRRIGPLRRASGRKQTTLLMKFTDQKPPSGSAVKHFTAINRGDRIRTCDFLVPNQAL